MFFFKKKMTKNEDFWPKFLAEISPFPPGIPRDFFFFFLGDFWDKRILVFGIKFPFLGRAIFPISPGFGNLEQGRKNSKFVKNPNFIREKSEFFLTNIQGKVSGGGGGKNPKIGEFSPKKPREKPKIANFPWGRKKRKISPKKSRISQKISRISPKKSRISPKIPPGFSSALR